MDSSWIFVKDDIPPVNRRIPVIVADHRVVAPAWWMRDHFEQWCEPGKVIPWVRSWMPMPEAPEAKK